MFGVCQSPTGDSSTCESQRLTGVDIVSICMFMFGIVMVCQGFVSNWGGLMTTRFFLGVFESGMFPGCKFSGRGNWLAGADEWQAST